MMPSKYKHSCKQCKIPIGPDYKNEYYGVNWNTYCSINCVLDSFKGRKDVPKYKRRKKKV